MLVLDYNLLLVTLVFHVSFWNHLLGAVRELCLGLCFGCMRLGCICISLGKSVRFRDEGFAVREMLWEELEELLSEERLEKEEIVRTCKDRERLAAGSMKYSVCWNSASSRMIRQFL